MGITAHIESTATPFVRGVFLQPDCANCLLRYEVKVPPEGNPQAEVMLVGEGPGEEELILGRPFVGRSGGALNSLLERLGVKRESLWITNAGLCKPRALTVLRDSPCPDCAPAKRQSKKNAIAIGRVDCPRCMNTRVVQHSAYLNDKQVLAEAAPHCRARLHAEINTIRPKVVVPLGRYALEACIGKSLGIMAHRGAVHVMQLSGGCAT